MRTLRKDLFQRLSVCSVVILFACLLGSCSPAGDNTFSPKMEADGFETPEEAVIAYLTGLKNCNLDHMISTFAMESYIENYDYEASINYYLGYNASAEVQMPNANDFVIDLNVERHRNNIADQILRQYVGLCIPEVNNTMPRSLKDELEVRNFAALLSDSLDTSKLETFSILGFIPVEVFLGSDQPNGSRTYIDEQTMICGADELVSILVMFEFDGDKYLMCMETIAYEGKWYNSRMGDILVNSPVDGSINTGVVPIADDLYEKYYPDLIPMELTEDSFSSANSKSATAEVKGFNSPEDAAIAYLEGLKDADLDGMISTFAIGSYIENYDFNALLLRQRVYTPFLDVRLPNTNEFVNALNEESRRGDVSSSILRQYRTLSNLSFDVYERQYNTDEMESSNFVAQFTDSLNTPNLNTLTILGFIPQEALFEYRETELLNDLNMKQANVCGADDQDSRIAVFELDNLKYFLFLDMIEYDGKWYNATLESNIGNILGISIGDGGIAQVPDEIYEEYGSQLLRVK